MRDVYGTLAHCRKANKPNGHDEPDTTTISATRIEGNKASTGVTLTSAQGATTMGRVTLVKVYGMWKVDRLGVHFLRSVFEALPKQASTAEERLVLDCLAESSRGLSGREVRRIGNQIVGRRLTPHSLPPDVVACIRTARRSSVH